MIKLGTHLIAIELIICKVAIQPTSRFFLFFKILQPNLLCRKRMYVFH